MGWRRRKEAPSGATSAASKAGQSLRRPTCYNILGLVNMLITGIVFKTLRTERN